MDDYGARVRAARCYADKDLADLAESVGVSMRTLARIEANERPLTIPEARDVAKATRVPLLFLLEGFRLYEEAERRLTELQTEPRRPQLPAPEGALGRSLEDDRTRGADQPRKGRPREAGRRRGGAG